MLWKLLKESLIVNGEIHNNKNIFHPSCNKSFVFPVPFNCFSRLVLKCSLKMAVKIILMLSFHLCLAHLELDIRAQAKNPCTQQCTQTKKDNFQKKHLLQKTPKTMDLEVWSRFLEENQLCSNKNRSVQSFLDSNQKSKVDEVCTPAGGKVFKPDSNLCISKKTFTFFEVYVNIDECKVFKLAMWANTSFWAVTSSERNVSLFILSLTDKMINHRTEVKTVNLHSMRISCTKRKKRVCVLDGACVFVLFRVITMLSNYFNKFVKFVFLFKMFFNMFLFI